MTLQELRKIMSLVFGIAPEEITEDATIDDIDVWDSIHHVDLVIELEKNTEERLNPSEIITLTSVAAILRRFPPKHDLRENNG